MCIVRIKWESTRESALNGTKCSIAQTLGIYYCGVGMQCPWGHQPTEIHKKFRALVTIFGFPLSLFFPSFLLDQINFWQMFGKSSYPVIHIYKSCCCSVVPILSLHWCQRIIWENATFPVMHLEVLVFLAQSELFRILIPENSKPNMVLHIDILDSWEVNRNRAPDLSSLGDSESLKFCFV